MPLRKIEYDKLNAREKENYNFLKVSAVLAGYGYMTTRLSDDWKGADFIAHHIDGETILRVQLKGRLDLREKYRRKHLYVAFRNEDQWYLYPHDEVLKWVLANTGVKRTVSWSKRGGYSFPGLSDRIRKMLEKYRIGSLCRAGPTGTGS